MKISYLKNISKHIIFLLFFFLLLGIIFTCHGSAAESGGDKFNHLRKNEGVIFELKGVGLKKYFFMKAFVAGLYYPKGVSPVDPLEDVAKHLEVEYFVWIPGKRFSHFTVEKMKDNLSREEFERIKKEIGSMEKYFVDLRPGDRFSLTYIPGEGTSFAHNGRIMGVIQGKEFARAIFSTWFGRKPFDSKLKRQILGSAEPDRSARAVFARRYT